MAFKIKTRGGRIRTPKLDNGTLTEIGNKLVLEQKQRWAKSIDSSGQTAKKLSVKYFFEKRGFMGGGSPKRDNKMTGLMVQNFALRKAIDGVIRAENTSRAGRQHARQSQGFEEMIGFAGSDVVAAMEASKKAYGQWMTKAWIPVG